MQSNTDNNRSHNIEGGLWLFEFVDNDQESIFAISCGVLMILSYVLSLFVAYLHIRKHPMVYPLTRPPKGQYFCEYFILIKTSLLPNSSFDQQLRGRVSIQLMGTFADSPSLELKKGRGTEFFLYRGCINSFVFHSPYNLGEITNIQLTVTNDAPYEIPDIHWRPCYISVIRPLTGEYWSTRITKKQICAEHIVVMHDCVKNQRDTNGPFKYLMQFHLWCSLFNRSVRYGMFTNFVNTIMLYFSMVCTGTLLMVFQFVRSAEDAGDHLSEGFRGEVVGILLSSLITFIISFILEIVIRNSAPKFFCQSFKDYSGLSEAIESPYLLRDFFINYDWDAVRPLLPKINVLMIKGTQHGYAQSIFPVTQPHSVFNLWGFYGINEQREWSMFMRSINAAALPLPLSMRWISKEAWSAIEDLIMTQHMSDYDGPCCFFHVWVQDWPIHYINEPQQVGMIITNIICRNLLTLIQMPADQSRSRLARLCLFQWYGMIAFMFLHVIVQEADRRNEATSAIKTFIYKAIDQYSYRSPAEIHTSWQKRKLHLKNIGVGQKQLVDIMGADEKELDDLIDEKKVKLMIAEKDHEESDYDDENMSARATKSIINYIRKLFFGKEEDKSGLLLEPHTRSSITDASSIDYDGFAKDELIFEEYQNPYEATDSRCHGDSKVGRFTSNTLKKETDLKLEIQHIEEEFIGFYREEDENRDIKHRRKKHAKDRSFSRFKDFLDLQNQDEGNQSQLKKPESEDCKLDITNNALKQNEADDTLNPIIKLDRLSEETQNIKRELQELGVLDVNTNFNPDKTEEKEGANKPADSEMLLKGEICPVADFEKVNIGESYTKNEDVMPMPDPKNKLQFYRHKNEVEGNCCKQDRCSGYLEIHQKVGHTVLETLKTLLNDLLLYAMDSRYNKIQRSKCWLRKRMVGKLFVLLRKKAILYENSDFKQVDGVMARNEDLGFISNQLLASNNTILQVILDVANINRQVCKLLQSRELEESKIKNARKQAGHMKGYTIPGQSVQLLLQPQPERPSRCLFCAKIVKNPTEITQSGCYNIEKLVKFFSRDTIVVAEKEINSEFASKLSIQNYCAMIVNISKKELLMELEDPPLVLCTKVCRAMIHTLLDERLPKHTEVKDMSADELKQIGTRRQRIQARHDTTLGTKLKESLDQKRRKALLQALIDEFAVKWRVNVKENSLHYCAQLLAQCLVQERIIGFSIYSGFISKDHEVLLDNSKDKLNEIEDKAYRTILIIAKHIFDPILKELLESGDEIDVLFSKPKMEISYFYESISVMQVSNVPSFLKTCCFYIDDIAAVKVREFKEYMQYMKKIKPLKDLFLQPKLTLMKGRRFLCDKEEIDVKFETQHMAIASPILRWGNIAITGEPPITDDLKPVDDAQQEESYEKMLPEVISNSAGDPIKEAIVSNIIKSRKTARNFVDAKQMDNSKQLQVHLARVQARLTDQIAIASQSMADAYVIDTDYQRDFLPEELYNVEFYCTGKMGVPFATLIGISICIALVCLTFFFLFFSMMKASQIGNENLIEWVILLVFSLSFYIFILDPIKCIIFTVFKMFQDCY